MVQRELSCQCILVSYSALKGRPTCHQGQKRRRRPSAKPGHVFSGDCHKSQQLSQVALQRMPWDVEGQALIMCHT